MGTAGWLCQAQGCRHAPWRDPECPLRAQSPSWEQPCVTPRSVSAHCRHTAVGGRCNPGAGQSSILQRWVCSWKPAPKSEGQRQGEQREKIIFLSAICSGTLCGFPHAPLPRLTAAEASERCCSPAEDDIHPAKPLEQPLACERSRGSAASCWHQRVTFE